MPDDEPGRLAERHTFAALDSSNDVDIDDLTALAARLCGTPIALVSLVDTERQWFKSRHGAVAVSETPRDVSFYTHAIAGSGLFEVPDALADPRFEHSPLVTRAPNIRFYAGAPCSRPPGMPWARSVSSTTNRAHSPPSSARSCRSSAAR